MRIVINYDSCWQTSFLDGDPNKAISKKENPRKFVATSGTRGETPAPISDTTILGVLCRLIGDQRKLYQSRQSENYYFSDIERKITWQLNDSVECNELVYITNKSDARCGKGTWLGVISDENLWFYSKVSPLLWSVLYLDRNEILEFILSGEANQPNYIQKIDCRPTALLRRLDKITDAKSEEGVPWLNAARLSVEQSKLETKLQLELDKREEYFAKNKSKPPKTEKQRNSYVNKLASFEQKIRNIEDEISGLKISECPKLDSVLKYLGEAYPDCEYISDGKLYPFRLYAAALYIQSERLIQRGEDLEFVFNKKEEIQIQGFSKRGFNGVRDWLNPMTGSRKKDVGTPCEIQKQSGQLEIDLDIDLDRAIDLKNKIDSAGVSSFYLGKKGLAYVADIDVR